MPIKPGSERTIHFHATSLTDLGLTLVHTPTTLAMGVSTGYVRISSINSDGGMVTGDVRVNDVVVEAAGVNMRRPISEGMWKLTLGLMEVAPLPLEIVVAEEMEENSVEEEQGKLTNQDTGMEEEKRGYYQLTTPSKQYNLVNDPVLSAKLYPLEGPGDQFMNEQQTAEGMTPNSDDKVETRDPFLDHNRFGPERIITFRTESLGVKLNRSPVEGIVHILHVTSYQPPEESTMKSPREGDLEVGDAIMEVGGVDLRHQFIGRLEWADMVHFIKYVERPLEMIVAKDTMFTGEGLIPLDNENDASDKVDIEEKKEDSGDNFDEAVQNQVETNSTEETKEVEANDQVEESSIVAIESNAAEALRNLDEDCNSAILDSPCGAVANIDCATIANMDNVCSVASDGICTSPRANATVDDIDDLCGTPADQEKGSAKTVDSSVVKILSPDHLKKDDSWIKRPSDEAQRSPPRSPLTLFPRTHPIVEQDASAEARNVTEEYENAAPPVDNNDDDNTTKMPESPVPPTDDGKIDKVVAEEVTTKVPEPGACESETDDVIVDESSPRENEPMAPPVCKSVAELRSLFSPIKLPEASNCPKPSPSEENPIVEKSTVDEAGEEDPKQEEVVSPREDVKSDTDPPISLPSDIEAADVTNVTISDVELDKTIDLDRLSPAVAHDVIKTPEDSGCDQSCEEPATTPEEPANKAVQPSDSRDDIEQRDNEKKDVAICPKPLKAPSHPAKLVSSPATFRSKIFDLDDDSPFCGNIKFSDAQDRVPASALFSQAFVVQNSDTNRQPITDNIRWESTTSPLFVTKKGSGTQKTPLQCAPFSLAERTQPETLSSLDPTVKGFVQTAFDMSEVDTSAQVSDDGSLSDDPSYNPNDTIVYADETEAFSNCCGFDSFCADNVMFEGLVSNCGEDPQAQRQTKEKANKVPSPRRKNLLSRLRKGSKKTKDKVGYGNLIDNDNETMKGIRKAHVQLRKQNLLGKSVEAASQYTPMSDLIEI
eukprot:scaffold919_cov74-Cyclotella_meneghiniana.AAC.7